MEKVKSVFYSILRKLGFDTSAGFDLKLHWKIVISLYLTLFAVLIIGGWLFYSWIIQTEVIPPKVKSNKPDITTEELNKAKTISEGKKNKLDVVVKTEPQVVQMK